MKAVYLDHAATTPVRAEVVEAMLPWFTEGYGNTSSAHAFGQAAKAAIEDARARIAALIGAPPESIIFTGGGTEADNLAIMGAVAAAKSPGHIIASSIEHSAVLKTCAVLEKQGMDVTHLLVDTAGVIEPDDLHAALRPDTAIVSVMLVNNEVGVIEPLREVCAICREVGVPVHTDAVQGVGKLPVDVDALGVDLLSASAHKFYGPKGVGFLYRRQGVRIKCIQHGGGHESGLRAGTVNTPGIMGMARAMELACAEMQAESARLKALCDRLESGLCERIPGLKVNSVAAQRLPGLLNVTIPNAEGEALLMKLDAAGIAVSTGSACSSKSLEPSHVLLAMGIPKDIIHGSMRFSFGHSNTADDVAYVLDHLPRIVEDLRAMSPL